MSPSITVGKPFDRGYQKISVMTVKDKWVNLEFGDGGGLDGSPSEKVIVRLSQEQAVDLSLMLTDSARKLTPGVCDCDKFRSPKHKCPIHSED